MGAMGACQRCMVVRNIVLLIVVGGALGGEAWATRAASRDDTNGQTDVVCTAAFASLSGGSGRRQELVYEYELHEGPTAVPTRDSGAAGDAGDRQVGLRMLVRMTALAPRRSRSCPPALSKKHVLNHTTPDEGQQCGGCLVRLRVMRGTGELVQRRRGAPLQQADLQFGGPTSRFESVEGRTPSLDSIISPDHDMCVGFTRVYVCGVLCGAGGWGGGL